MRDDSSFASAADGMRCTCRCPVTGLFITLLVLGTSAMSAAQDLEPRSYAASPVGARFLVVAAGGSSGDVVVDASLPLQDVSATVKTLTIGTGGTVDLFGRTALIIAAVPYAWAEASGRVGERTGSISRTGLADPRLKLSVNLIGGQALAPRDFARAERSTIVGVSLVVAPPLGQYERTKLINLGANRWSFKPEMGASRLVRRWTIEGYAGAWLFTANDEYYTGASRRTQRPVFALQGHASYTARPRLWIAVDGTWYSGGTTSVDGREQSNLQRNSRIGATVSLPLWRQQSIKVAGSAGATTRAGANFRTVTVAWQLSWVQ